MPKILWDNAYNTGSGVIDTQHRELIEYYNAAHEHMLSNQDTSSLGLDALIKMIDYCRYHFDSEEAYMEKMGFSDLEEHKKIHAAFHDQIKELLLMDHEDRILTSQILKIFENWIVDHILNLDKKIIQKNGNES